MSRIFVTGVGLISPIGNSASENRAALQAGLCGIGKAKFLKSIYSDLLPLAEVKISTTDLMKELQVSDKGVTRTSLISMYAFRQAVSDAALSENTISNADTAFIGANTVGGMCLTDEMYRDANSKSEGSEFLTSYDFASVTNFIGNKYKTRGVVNTINTACSSSANSIIYGARLIKNGLAKRAIVGGGDSLAKFTVNGFNSLNILSKEICKPFDENRKGLNLGEGAAFIVLEKEEDIRGKKVYAELTGYNNTNDAYHPSSLSDTADGPYLAMKGALELAQLRPSDISFINVHGTGTENNDRVESIALQNLFKQVPEFASTKSNMGHTLGASGSVEAVCSILNIYHSEIYPALNFSSPIPETGLIPVQKFQQKKIKHVLSNSFGFGGNCSSLIFSKAQ